MVFLHGSMVIIARGASRNVRIVEKCQNCKNLPINGIVYFHHGDNIVYTRFNNCLSGSKVSPVIQSSSPVQ